MPGHPWQVVHPNVRTTVRPRRCVSQTRAFSWVVSAKFGAAPSRGGGGPAAPAGITDASASAASATRGTVRIHVF